MKRFVFLDWEVSYGWRKVLRFIVQRRYGPKHTAFAGIWELRILSVNVRDEQFCVNVGEIRLFSR